jgi:thiol-disulfide isomerase/thioredoxin
LGSLPAKHPRLVRALVFGAGALMAVALIAGLERKRWHGAASRSGAAWPADVRPITVEGAMQEVHSARGRPVLLIVYASWCTGCREEMSSVDELAASYRPRGLEVIALAREDDVPGDYIEWMGGQTKAFEKIRLLPAPEGAVRAAIEQLGGAYDDAIPYAAVLDRDGKLVKDWPHGGATKNAIEESIVRALSRAPEAL